MTSATPPRHDPAGLSGPTGSAEAASARRDDLREARWTVGAPAAVGARATLSRRGLLAGLLTPLAAPLSGCGFQPIYMPTASGNPGVAERELASVNVALIPDRPGQLLRQALQQRMASDGGGQKRYDLRVVYWIAGEGVSVLTDNSATRLRLTGNANWVLVAIDPSQARLTQGSARTIDAVNIFNQQFFALDMQNDVVQRRIAEQVAEQIATQLALWFRQRAS